MAAPQETEMFASCLRLAVALPSVLLLLPQTASNLVKGQVKHLSDMRVQSIKHHDPGLEMTDVPPEEAWSVQLFRTIDSSTCFLLLYMGSDWLQSWQGGSLYTCCDDCAACACLCMRRNCPV
jgi:hypothetical protein